MKVQLYRDRKVDEPYTGNKLGAIRAVTAQEKQPKSSSMGQCSNASFDRTPFRLVRYYHFYLNSVVLSVYTLSNRRVTASGKLNVTHERRPLYRGNGFGYKSNVIEIVANRTKIIIRW
jgi:hypothetical protein